MYIWGGMKIPYVHIYIFGGGEMKIWFWDVVFVLALVAFGLILLTLMPLLLQ